MSLSSFPRFVVDSFNAFETTLFIRFWNCSNFKPALSAFCPLLCVIFCTTLCTLPDIASGTS
ncbi:hypothetical protein EUBVEN_01509 [Eubacterium ventriosum ATCC 27560]|uniref:Uncharacterized protein n=1 Tax=Eubacterium ventriosum ATCC 27560 TaxID=411463 RepID=A5Z727_9FIRM|nr:hypothetical protein EUBVEN_01509 [Eubacterium ventriosum ATCC 27560]